MTGLSADAGATSGPAHKVKSTVSTVGGHEIGYPHGHLGHLNHEEEAALRGFKALLAEHGLYQAGPPPSHDDQTLVRFLRARRWVAQDAYKQFKDTEDWRKANNLDVLYDTIDVEAYEQSRRLYPQWTGRRDRRGIPLYLFEIRHLDSKSVSAYEKSAENTYSKAHVDGKTPPKLLRLFALYENLTRFAQPLCTQLPDRDHPTTPITLSTNIVDVTGVSLRQFWNLKAHMQAASTLATAHYPETLDRIFIIGAPYFFSTVWGWIKRWFDPITVSKIFILPAHEVKTTLEEFIDPKNIPAAYGGELDFKFGQLPKQDPFIQERAEWANGYTDFPTGPLYWRPVEGDPTRLECLAVGSVNQVERRARVCTIPKSFPPEVKPEEPVVAAEGVEKATAAEEPVPSTEAVAEIDKAVQGLEITDKSEDAAKISEKVAEVEVEAKAAPTTASA
ncbi:CRAL-TRIO domain-containing protein [Cercophora scortea]|uniref:CRAL-TRIO domain-containing protein n=1 Tax=Cercophora scortea TaxID=314031 RepID=A0AAE0IGT7_9PEZI|nr:CRAL-TRIO domain-containing protein [Cercophora scortea]